MSAREVVDAGEVVAWGTVASEGPAVGTLRQATSVTEVLALMDTDLSETIIRIEHASVTSIVPILPQVRGVVCEGGGVTSHIAIVSRQFGLPCIVAARFDVPPASLEGRRVSFGEDGRVLLVPDGA